MRLLARAALLAFAGVVIGAIHSYCAPISLRPENNPETAPTGPGEELGPAGAQATSDPGGPATPKAEDPPTPAQDRPTPPPAAASTQPNYFIDIEKAKSLHERGRQQHDVYFADARPAKDYLAGHVKGAMHLPPEVFAGRPPQKIDFLPGMVVVVYCHGASCTDSEAVMIRLQNLKRDIGPIYIMRDGFDTWKARGWPVEAGPDQSQ